MAFVDTHCHLQDPRFQGQLEALLARAQAAGISHLVCCGTREEDWPAVLELAGRHPAVLPMLGLHPWFVGEATPHWLGRLEALARSHRIGIGEIGLDFALEEADREAQDRAFRAQLRLARELDRPVSIHCRRAWEALAKAAREEGLPAAGAVVHAYSGSAETARELQSLGFSLAFGCSLANPENRRAAKAVQAVAVDRLLFETDAPDLPPRHLPEYREGRPNEPVNLPLVLEAAADLRGESKEALAAAVQANALRIFGGLIPPESSSPPENP